MAGVGAGDACDRGVHDQQSEEEQESPWDLLEQASCWDSPQACADRAGQQDVMEQQGLEGAGLRDHIMAEFNADLWHGEQGARLQRASVVVGLHPDQVTTCPCMACMHRCCANVAVHLSDGTTCMHGTRTESIARNSAAGNRCNRRVRRAAHKALRSGTMLRIPSPVPAPTAAAQGW